MAKCIPHHEYLQSWGYAGVYQNDLSWCVHYKHQRYEVRFWIRYQLLIFTRVYLQSHGLKSGRLGTTRRRSMVNQQSSQIHRDYPMRMPSNRPKSIWTFPDLTYIEGTPACVLKLYTRLISSTKHHATPVLDKRILFCPPCCVFYKQREGKESGHTTRDGPPHEAIES